MHVATGGPVARRIEVPRRLRVYRAVLSRSGAVVRELGLRHQRQLCVGGDIADTTAVADETDPTVAPTPKSGSPAQ